MTRTSALGLAGANSLMSTQADSRTRLDSPTRTQARGREDLYTRVRGLTHDPDASGFAQNDPQDSRGNVCPYNGLPSHVDSGMLTQTGDADQHSREFNGETAAPAVTHPGHARGITREDYHIRARERSFAGVDSHWPTHARGLTHVG
jgi:hypothetical protein